MLICTNPECVAHKHPSPDREFISFDILKYKITADEKFIEILGSTREENPGYYCALCEHEAIYDENIQNERAGEETK